MKILIALGDLRFDDISKIIRSTGGKESLLLPSNRGGRLNAWKFLSGIFICADTGSIRQPPMPFVLRSPSDSGRFGFVFSRETQGKHRFSVRSWKNGHSS
jgi:hypothetical protein